MDTLDAASSPAAGSGPHAAFLRLRDQLSAEIVGQSALVERLLVALLADGHLLVEGAPGLAKTTAIRTLAAHVRLMTVELSRLTGLKTAAIWGLLKVRRASGQLVFDGTAWEINRAWLPPEIKRAAELLRSRGWTVVAPGERS